MTLLESIFAALFVLGVFGYVLYVRVKENRYLRKTTPQAVSKALKEEIEEEEREIQRKK